MDVVRKFVHAWARPGLAQPVWYAGVRDLAVPGYARMLAMTTPANVPAHLVTGPPMVRSSSTVAVIAEVPTDAGTVRVTVVPLNGRWLVATAIGTSRR